MQANYAHALEENLERYSLGTLSEAESEVLEEHLLICPSCQDRLTEMDAFVHAMQVEARKFRARRRWSWQDPVLNRTQLAWAFGAVFCVVMLLWVAGIRRSPTAGSSPPVAVALVAVRGTEQTAVARAPLGRALALEADLAGLPLQGACVMEVVDSLGAPARQSEVKPEGTKLTLRIPAGLNQGRYWVRLYASGPQKELLREYALQVQ